MGSLPRKQLKYPRQSSLPAISTGAAYNPVFPSQNSVGLLEPVVVATFSVVVGSFVVVGAAVVDTTVVPGTSVVTASHSTFLLQSQFLVVGLKR